jgi:hypothetical protein
LEILTSLNKDIVCSYDYSVVNVGVSGSLSN